MTSCLISSPVFLAVCSIVEMLDVSSGQILLALPGERVEKG